MKAMRYMIKISAGMFPELSIFVDNHHNKTFFLFINQVDGAFMMTVPEGKSRLEKIEKETTQTLDVGADNSIVCDLIEAVMNRHNDTKVLWKRYMANTTPPVVQGQSHPVGPQPLPSAEIK